MLKNKNMLKKIICRFDNVNDINILSKKIGFKLNSKITEFNLDNLKIIKTKIKKVSKKPHIDKYDYSTHYVGMPEFKSKKILPFHKIVFITSKNIDTLSEIFEQNISDKTKSIWFPKLIPGKHSPYRAICGEISNKYPIYVVSKGRHDLCYTSKFLSLMEVKHYICVEPRDYNLYKEHRNDNFVTILQMDMKYKDDYDLFDKNIGIGNGTGPGPARNFCWEHSLGNGHKWHWVMDDNTIEGFHWLYQNSKIKLRSGSFFRAIEDFVDRYQNIAIGGLNYTMFCKMTDRVPPYVLNTRIYSFLLIRNDIKYRWRGRYNEDTDLSLRVLKDGWCTIQFNSMTAGKCATQKLKGGNTTEFYAKEGTLNKSQMLVDMHPDVAKHSYKFNRHHHHVDYSSFKQKLKLNDGVDLTKIPKVDNYGMKIILSDSKNNTWQTNTELIQKYKHKLDCYKQPTLNTYDEQIETIKNNKDDIIKTYKKSDTQNIKKIKKPLSFAELMRAKKSKK